MIWEYEREENCSAAIVTRGNTTFAQFGQGNDFSFWTYIARSIPASILRSHRERDIRSRWYPSHTRELTLERSSLESRSVRSGDWMKSRLSLRLLSSLRTALTLGQPLSSATLSSQSSIARRHTSHP